MAATFVLACTAHGAGEESNAAATSNEASAQTSTEIRVYLPDRTEVNLYRRPPKGDTGRPSRASSATSSSSRRPHGLMRSQRLTPPYCDTPDTDPDICARIDPPIDDTDVVFDLRCATYGAVPSHCSDTYPESPNGRFLDVDGRPYPPLPGDIDGRPIDKHFPQFFEHPSMRLHVYTNSHDGGWVLTVDMVEEPSDTQQGATVGQDHFAVKALQTSSGWAVHPSASERDPTWKCFGQHPAWPTEGSGAGEHVCPAPQNEDGIILAERTSAGWHDFQLGMKLLLDGTEVPGQYEGLLRYTIVTF